MSKPHFYRGPLTTFLVLLVSIWLLVGWAASLLISAEYRAELDGLKQSEAKAIRVVSDGLVNRIGSAIDDVAFISRMPRLREAISTPTSDGLDGLAQDLMAYEAANPSIDQLRWIDLTGQERLRVNRVNGVPTRVPAAQLQNKSGRPYVTAALNLPPRSIYLSPLDLNVEHGQIELPYKPTVRVAAPIWGADANGAQGGEHRLGILVINYLATRWVNSALRAARHTDGQIMLLNGEGYWLFGPKPADDWGFMLGHPDRTMAHADPSVWDALVHAPTGGAVFPSGLWTWENVRPLDIIEQLVRRQAAMISVVGNQPYAWRIASHVSAAELARLRIHSLRHLTPTLAALLIIAALISAWAAWSQLQIARLNRALAERAQAAEDATRAKAAFLANMSHEIRTPMNAVLGIAYLLERMRLPGEASDLVSKIRNAGRSLQSIINDILDYSKIESGRLEIEIAPFKLHDVLETLTDIMGANVGDKDVEIVITPPTDGVDSLRGDALRLGQVLINLTSNAIKFTDHGHVELAVQTVKSEPGRVTLRFTVRDTGVGISADRQKEIFQPFTQADVSTTRRFGGTGLGLAISRELVQMMGGEIALRSTLGKGSEFSFTLSFERDVNSRISEPEMSNLQVLIADDSEIARDALRATATALGWQPTLVASGGEAVERALHARGRQQASDVIVLDWKMPGMNGLAAARAIHEGTHGEHAPIIIMVTAQSRESLIDEPDAALADAVLSKPIAPSTLYNAVARAMIHREDRIVGQDPLAAGGQRLRGVRLLVVDDSDINREVARRIFGGEGAEVALANDGKEAVAWLNAHPDQVDVVLMDVQMPVMDGYEAARIIRATPALEKLPIVALTAGAFKAQKEAALAAGMTHYIAKPFDIDAAISLIWQIASGNTGPAQPHLPARKEASAAPAVLAVNRGLALWKDAAVYRHYLRKFAEHHADFARTIQMADPATGSAMAHRLKGSAANLALEAVAAAARDVENKLAEKADAVGEIAALQRALQAAVAAIDQFAPEPPAAHVAEAAGDAPPTSQLLYRVLNAFDKDDPSAIEPLLAELAAVVSPVQLAPLHDAVDNFDFRSGEQATRALARELGIDLEETR